MPAGFQELITEEYKRTGEALIVEVEELASEDGTEGNIEDKRLIALAKLKIRASLGSKADTFMEKIEKLALQEAGNENERKFHGTSPIMMQSFVLQRLFGSHHMENSDNPRVKCYAVAIQFFNDPRFDGPGMALFVPYRDADLENSIGKHIIRALGALSLDFRIENYSPNLMHSRIYMGGTNKINLAIERENYLSHGLDKSSEWIKSETGLREPLLNEIATGVNQISLKSQALRSSVKLFFTLPINNNTKLENATILDSSNTLSA